MPVACRGYVLVENYISTRSAHFSTVFFHTCLKLRNRQSGQAVLAWGRDFHTLFHTLWKTGFCGFVAGCRTGVGYDIFCDFCIISLVCLLGYLVNWVGLWGAGGRRPPTLPFRNPLGGLAFLVACLPFYFSFDSAPIPPTPFPSGEGGDLKFSYARGFAPCIPGAEWEAARAFLVESGTQGASPLAGRGEGGVAVPGGGRRGGSRLPTLPCRNPAGGAGGRSPASPAFSFVSAPIPPAPLPLRGRGRLKVFLCKGLRPLHPRR